MFELSSHLDLSEGLVHAANILLLISFSLKSMLMLRALNILAGGCFILYFAQLSEPLWASVAWNVLFGVVNLRHIWMIILERRAPLLSADAQKLHHLVFPRLERHGLKRFIERGEWKTLESTDVLIAEGDELERVWIIVEGALSISSSDSISEKRALTDGDVLGESAFFQPQRAMIQVHAELPTRCISWSHNDLRTFFEDEPTICSAIQHTFAQSLARKIQMR